MKRISFASRMRALVVCGACVALCVSTTGCAQFLFLGTTTYHKAATREVVTTIRVAEVSSAHLHPNGTLNIAFSGWNNCRTMSSESKMDYSVQVQTIPDFSDPSVSHPTNHRDGKGSLRYLRIDRTNVGLAVPVTKDTIPLPVHIMSMKDMRSGWKTLVNKQVGPCVWLRTDRLWFLYVPAPESAGTVPSLLVRSHAEMTRRDPLLMYGYPVAIPILIAVDIVTLPVKAGAIVIFFATWDGNMF